MPFLYKWFIHSKQIASNLDINFIDTEKILPNIDNLICFPLFSWIKELEKKFKQSNTDKLIFFPTIVSNYVKKSNFLKGYMEIEIILQKQQKIMLKTSFIQGIILLLFNSKKEILLCDAW